MYKDLLLECDIKLSEAFITIGIHHCGNNIQIHAGSYARVKRATFFDVGWGSDNSACLKILPEAFLNLCYDPVMKSVRRFRRCSINLPIPRRLVSVALI